MKTEEELNKEERDRWEGQDICSLPASPVQPEQSTLSAKTESEG